MLTFLKYIIIYFLLNSANYQTQLFAADQIDTVRIAVRALSGVEAATEKWTATANYLSNSIDGYTFLIEPITSFDEMREVVENNEVDFVFTDPSAHIDLGINYGTTRLATLINMGEGCGCARYGGVIFTRADRHDINEFNDLIGKSIMGFHPESFGGWRMEYRELIEVGIDPFKDCSEVIFSQNGTQEEVVRNVLQGIVDIGTVRTGLLENMVTSGNIDRGDFKIIGSIADDFPLLHSTRLYPEWPFVSLKHTNDLLTKEVTIALLQMKPDNLAAREGGYTGWKTPSSYGKVLLLLKELKISPFNVQHTSILGFIKLYWKWFILAVLAGLLVFWIIIYIARINAQLRVMQKKLEQQVMHGEDRIREISENASDMIYRMSLPDGRYEYVNQACVRMFGYTPAEFYDSPLLIKQAIHPDSLKYFEESWAKLIKGEMPPTYEYQIVHKSGTVKWLYQRNVLINNDQGDPIAIEGIVTDITEHKQSQKAIQHLSDRTKAILSAVPDIIMEVNEQLVYTWANKAGLAFFGNDVIGKEAQYYFEGEQDTYEAVSPIFKDTAEELIYVESWQRRKDGEKRLLAWWCQPLKNNEGYIGAISSARDITENKQAQEKLKANEQFLNSVFNSVQDGISILDPDLTIKHVNGTMNKWYQVNLPLEGKKCYEAYHNSDKPCDPCPSLRCFDSGKTESNIIRGLPGSPIEFIELYSYPIKNSDSNEVTEVVEYVRNITSRKQAENSLRESEEKYRLIVENANDGIEITQDDKIIYTNNRFADMLGYSVETLKNIHFRTLFTKQALQELYERQKIRKISKQLYENYETTFYKQDGSIIDVAVKSKIIDYQGKPATFAIIRDITERKQANKKIADALREARQALEVKDQFIANMSHEIRTPLNSILGFSDLLRMRFSEVAGPSEKKIFTYMKASNDRLLRTVDSILDMSQLAAGSVQISPEILNLDELVISVTQELTLFAKKKQLEFHYKLAKQPSIIYADKDSIHKALINLTENAIKFTNKGSVELKLEQKDGQTVLSVIDTGIGISKEHQQRIFEPYTQESEGFTKNFQGIGLGLALTVRYLELNHVKLNLVSTKGVGSTFTLTFPIFEEKTHNG